jgi:autotransporter-associated beta strand protein
MLTLNGTNTYSGITIVNAGSLALGNTLALQNSTLDTSGEGAISFSTLTAATLGGLQGSNALSLRNSSSIAVALTVGNNNSSTTLSGNLTGSGSLMKIGSGKLTLGGANTYSGGTTVTGGTLNLTNTSGSATGSGNVTVGNGTANSGTIAGTGSIGTTAAPINTFTINVGGTLNSGVTVNTTNGSSAGNINLGTGLVTINTTVTFTLGGEIDATVSGSSGTTGLAYGQIAFGNSTVSLAGAKLELTASNYTYQPGDILYLLTDPGASGWASGSTYLEDQNGNPIYNGGYYTIAGTNDTFKVSYLADPGVELQAQPADVPEASTVAMLAGAAMMGLGYVGLRRIRRRNDDDGSAEAEGVNEKVAS